MVTEVNAIVEAQQKGVGVSRTRVRVWLAF